jgi:hypothetical protein
MKPDEITAALRSIPEGKGLAFEFKALNKRLELELTDFDRQMTKNFIYALTLLAASTLREQATIESKDNAYRERNQLVAFISKLYPSHLAMHPDSDESWERDWMNIVCIHAPFGQLTWHIHDSEIGLFSHLQYVEGDWDGHSTEEKYNRIAAALSGEPTLPPDPLGDAFATLGATVKRVLIIAQDPPLSNALESLALCREKSEKDRLLLKAAMHALRSYQFGNGSSDLAESTANTIEKHLTAVVKEE